MKENEIHFQNSVTQSLASRYQAFGGENWTEGVDRLQLERMMSFFFPHVGLTKLDVKSATSNVSKRHTLCAQPDKSLFRDLMIDEYIGSGEDRVKNRDGLIELLGDLWFSLPAIQIANAHRGISNTHENPE